MLLTLLISVSRAHCATGVAPSEARLRHDDEACDPAARTPPSRPEQLDPERASPSPELYWSSGRGGVGQLAANELYFNCTPLAPAAACPSAGARAAAPHAPLRSSRGPKGPSPRHFFARCLPVWERRTLTLTRFYLLLTRLREEIPPGKLVFPWQTNRCPLPATMPRLPPKSPAAVLSLIHI